MMSKIKEFIFGNKSEANSSINNTNASKINFASKAADNIKSSNEQDTQLPQAKLKKTETQGVQNPYAFGAEGRKEWNDRYMNMSKAVKNWQIACAVIALIALLQTVVIAKIASESRIQPYVVETAQGVPYAMKPVQGLSDKDKILVNYAINRFVINAKTIISDTQAEREMMDELYAYSAGNTAAILQDYYEKNNPFTIASDYTVSVNIVNALPVSKNTWQITWEEVKRQVNGGAIVETTKWEGQFTYQYGDVKNVTRNPFGIYITNFSWSQSR